MKRLTDSAALSPNELKSLCCFWQGVLRIHFLEALDLEGKDKFLGGLIKGKSDPYGVLQIGNQLFQSKTVKESLHPKWNEVYEVSASGQTSSRSVRSTGVGRLLA